MAGPKYSSVYMCMNMTFRYNEDKTHEGTAMQGYDVFCFMSFFHSFSQINFLCMLVLLHVVEPVVSLC